MIIINPFFQFMQLFTQFIRRPEYLVKPNVVFVTAFIFLCTH